MKGVDAVIHMAAIPNPLGAPEHEVFRVNMTSDWNVLEAAEVHGIRKVVKASSINAVGAVFSKERVDPAVFSRSTRSTRRRAEDSYSQSKWLGEEMSDGFCRRREMQIASMRFHALMDDARQADLRDNGDTTTADGRTAKEFWGWTDIGEAATACRLALEVDWTGHEAFFINATDTVLTVPTEEAIGRGLPRRGSPFTAAGLCVGNQRRKGKRPVEVGPPQDMANGLMRKTGLRDIRSGANLIRTTPAAGKLRSSQLHPHPNRLPEETLAKLPLPRERVGACPVLDGGGVRENRQFGVGH